MCTGKEVELCRNRLKFLEFGNFFQVCFLLFKYFLFKKKGIQNMILSMLDHDEKTLRTVQEGPIMYEQLQLKR